jgi:acetoin utilization deacetylase AcuC-like enzyme
MKTVHSPNHRLQDAEAEYIRGQRVPSFEMPRRAELVLDAVRTRSLGAVVEPPAFGTDPLLAVHDAGFIEFLSTIWDRWRAEVGEIDAFPNAWRPPRSVNRATTRPGAELGRYCIDMSSPIMAGTWTAATSAADSALHGATLVRGGERAAFALCRPPGHHAGRDYYGGYCFLNNAAIAAKSFRDAGLDRVAVLDVDYHHGNGTQDIFDDRGDVLTVSIHADPAVEYPYYNGYADERGSGAGEGANLNLPLPHGTGWQAYGPALDRGLERITAFGAQALVVSLGVDTFGGDPISRFRLVHDDYVTMGAAIASVGLPTLFVMEGGYAVAEIGTNTVNVLSGFEGGAA